MAEVFKSEHENFEMRRKASFSKLQGTAPRNMQGMYATDFDLHADKKREKIWKLMETYLTSDAHSIQRSIVNHVEYTLARTRFNFDKESCYRATAFSIRDRLIETLNDTNAFFHEKDVKRCYYLSLEFLLGRAMQNALLNLDIEENYRSSLEDLGYHLEELCEYEHDPALGNGGLGRLAACFLDSMATMNYPCWGYGIRYTYGIFEQKIVNGYQVEHPDYWLVQDNPWEIERPDVTYAVRFYGNVKEFRDPKSGRVRHKWLDGEIVQAVAYDNPIPGFDTYNTINLRLWRATPPKEFDFHAFNEGQFLESVRERQRAECISAVLYPNDNTDEGKELRLKQQYFFVCATLQDVLRRFKLKGTRDWKELPEKVCMQLNDTHPTIAIPEAMRILVDVEGLEWPFAWSLTKQIVNYTNHTVLPEAHEKWPVSLIERLLPRHLLIINDINFNFLNEVREVWPNDGDRLSSMSIYQEGYTKLIRMANLAVIGSNKVNGVAAIHSEIVKKTLFKDFREYYELKGINDKFVNVTNGVTPRRWIQVANRPLGSLLQREFQTDTWLKHFEMIEGLKARMDKSFLEEWAATKLENKKRLAKWVEHNCGVVIDPETMLFDIHVKRIHEYKRQLMFCMWILHRYLTLKRMSPTDREKVQPRCCFIGGKAAPGYTIAKNIIKMCNSISTVLNGDADTNKYLKMIFLPNYNVSNAQVIIPASDISEHISTAGTEASGTSNMKFVMNGGLIIGTLDGANVEIVEECGEGEDMMFIFGAKECEVAGIRERAKRGDYPIDTRLTQVFDFVRNGNLRLGDEHAHTSFCELVDRLCDNRDGRNSDFYIVCHDFPQYCDAHDRVDAAYANKDLWWKMSVKAMASMKKFTTDRTIQDYAEVIWNLKVSERPRPDMDLMRVTSFPNEPTKSGKSGKSTSQDLKTVINENRDNNTLNVEPTPQAHKSVAVTNLKPEKSDKSNADTKEKKEKAAKEKKDTSAVSNE